MSLKLMRAVHPSWSGNGDKEKGLKNLLLSLIASIWKGVV